MGAWWMLMERDERRERSTTVDRASEILDIVLYEVARVWE